MFIKKQFSSKELDETLSMLEILSQLSFAEFKTEWDQQKYGRFFTNLWILSARWEDRFVAMKTKFAKLFDQLKKERSWLWSFIKESEIISAKKQFSADKKLKLDDLKYKIVRKIKTTDDVILIVWIPYQKIENSEYKRKFWWSVAISKNNYPELFKKAEEKYQFFIEEDDY